MKWQPMETAPHGEEVLIGDSTSMSVAKFDGREWVVFTDAGWTVAQTYPFAWMRVDPAIAMSGTGGVG